MLSVYESYVFFSSQDGFADFTSFNSSQAPAKNSSSSDLFDVFSASTNTMQSSVPIQPVNQGLVGSQPMQPMGQNISAPGLNMMSSGAASGMPSGNLMGQPMMSQPGMMTSQQAMMTSQPVMMASQPAVMASQPGMMTSQPGMMSHQPGMMSQQPGMMSQQPGMMGMQQPVSKNFHFFSSYKSIISAKEGYWDVLHIRTILIDLDPLIYFRKKDPVLFFISHIHYLSDFITK